MHLQNLRLICALHTVFNWKRGNKNTFQCVKWKVSTYCSEGITFWWINENIVSKISFASSTFKPLSNLYIRKLIQLFSVLILQIISIVCFTIWFEILEIHFQCKLLHCKNKKKKHTMYYQLYFSLVRISIRKISMGISKQLKEII